MILNNQHQGILHNIISALADLALCVCSHFYSQSGACLFVHMQGAETCRLAQVE